MRRLHWLLWLVTGLGAGMIAAGWILDGSADYTPNFLLQIGSTLFLLVPIAVLEQRLHRTEQHTRAIDEGLRRVDQQVRRTAEEVQRLGRTSTEVEDGYGARESALVTAESRRDQTSVRQALDRAREVGAVSPHGVRVPASGLTPARLRFRPADGTPGEVQVRLEAPDRVSGWQSWRQGENPRRLIRRITTLARELQIPGQGLTRLPLEELVALLRLAVASHTGDGRDLGSVIEVADEEWVISEDGLYARLWPYRIPREVLLEGTEALGPYRVSNAPLADPIRLMRAAELAREAYGAG